MCGRVRPKTALSSKSKSSRNGIHSRPLSNRILPRPTGSWAIRAPLMDRRKRTTTSRTLAPNSTQMPKRNVKPLSTSYVALICRLRTSISPRVRRKIVTLSPSLMWKTLKRSASESRTQMKLLPVSAPPSPTSASVATNWTTIRRIREV